MKRLSLTTLKKGETFKTSLYGKNTYTIKSIVIYPLCPAANYVIVQDELKRQKSFPTHRKVYK